MSLPLHNVLSDTTTCIRVSDRVGVGEGGEGGGGGGGGGGGVRLYHGFLCMKPIGSRVSLSWSVFCMQCPPGKKPSDY